MFFIVLIAVLLLLLFSVWLLKVRIFTNLKFTPQDKNVKFELFIDKYKIADYVFMIQRNEKEHIEVQYFKKGLLIHTYTIKKLLELWKEKRVSKKVSFIRDMDIFAYKDKLRIERVSIHTDLGWDDAATTALLQGLYIAVINTLLGKLYESYGQPQKISMIKINPFYQKKTFNAAFEIVFAMRLVYLLLARLKVLVFKAKQKNLDVQKKDKIFKDRLTHKNTC